MVVLVTGANGQVGQSLKAIAAEYPNLEWLFCDSKQLDITSADQVNAFFADHSIQFCINTAAFTAVDLAESQAEKAHLVNAVGPENLAKACAKMNCNLLHLSTDFVFDGNGSKPYVETDPVNPSSVYGKTKLAGELAIQRECSAHYIVRTSWVYSIYGHNFLKTMLRLAKDRTHLKVVHDQRGTPTHAVDLAHKLVDIIEKHQTVPFGTYHYSNAGACTWFEFAEAIFAKSGAKVEVEPIPTTDYPTPAQRPAYSVLDKTKLQSALHCAIPDWKDELNQLDFSKIEA